MKRKKQDNFHIIYGKHAVKSVLLNAKRPIYKVFLLEKPDRELASIIENLQLKFEIIPREKMTKFCKDGDKHQGYLIHAGDMIEEMKFEKYIELYAAKKENFSILIIDRVQDPHNIGAILRSVYCFGIDLVLKTKYDTPAINSSVIRSSAGMSEFLDIITITNINEVIKVLKLHNFHISGLDAQEGALNIRNSFKNFAKNAFIIGNEGNGIKQSVLENCDQIVKIPMQKDAESLNVSNAAAIAMYELGLHN